MNNSDCITDECYDAEIYVYHFINNDSNFSLLSKVYDFEKNCAFDLYAAFLDSSLTITDLDKNGIAEITFVYKLSCRSDIFPARMKLIMLENNQKYALRGNMINEYFSHLSDEDKKKEIKESGWGQFTVDEQFEKAPKVFLEFAKNRWNKFVDKDNFAQF